MKLFAVYNIEKDIFTLNNVPPTPDMVGDEGVIFSTKTYVEDEGEWVAVMKNQTITILSRLEFYQLFGDQLVQFDKEAYFVKGME
jgi:hypothetical protein